MAKTNNKGFTLIEIVIAVAILSVLLTPILKQFANTLETSRKAKALQEVNEMAGSEMEEFQTVSREDLNDRYGDPTIHADLSVTMYDTSANEIATDLTYSASWLEVCTDAAPGPPRKIFDTPSGTSTSTLSASRPPPVMQYAFKEMLPEYTSSCELYAMLKEEIFILYLYPII